MKNRRSRLEIFIDVLQVVKDGTTKPTRIMYGANLSWNIVQSVLNSMTEQGLIDEIDESQSRDKRTSKVYQITTKGDSVIRYFNQASKLIELEDDGFNPLKMTRQ